MSEPLRVLQIEDSESDAALIVRRLERSNYAVSATLVQNEPALVEALARGPWDVIIADFQLPEFDVTSALKTVRQSGLDVPFIVVSGTIGEERAVELMKAGAHDYLLKDDLARLAPAVAREIAEARVRGMRRDAERRLAESQEQFNLAIEATELGTLDGNPLLHTFTTSDVLKRHFGLPSGDEPPYQTYWNAIHPDDLRRVVGLIEEALRPESGGRFSAEGRVIGVADGKERFLSAWGRVLFDDQGRPARFIGATRDVTNQKQGEQRLQLQAQLTQAITHQATDSIFVTDPNGCVTFANPEAEKVFGFTQEEMRGRVLHDLIHERHPDGSLFTRLESPLSLAFTAGVSVRDHEDVFFRKDRSMVPVSCSNAPLVLDGERIGAVLSVRDISGRKQAEAALRESEERFRRLVEADVVGIMIAGTESIYEANDYFLKMIGYSREDFVARSVSLADITPPEYGGACSLAFSDLFDRGSCSAFEKEYFRKDGTRIPVLLGGVTLQRSPELRYLCFAVDLTERKNLEEQFRQAQKMESIGQLAAGVAHDFNNLLTVISGYSQMAIANLNPGHVLYDQLEEIRNAATRAAGLTRQLLTFSRQQPTAPKNIPLNTLVRDIDKMLRRLVGADIDFTLSLDDASGVLHADPGQIEQVILNLVVNAQDAMPDGGKLMVETSAFVVGEGAEETPLAARPGSYARLVVRDTGAGMTPEVKARIFEPFFTTKEYGKGTGLGLSTAYGIVKQNGGFISVESEPNQGTVFTVLLPNIEVAEAAPTPIVADASTFALAGGERILLVEDETGVRRFIHHVLEEYGYTVIECSNGHAAVELLSREDQPVDLLLTDMIMPEVGGGDLIEFFQAARPGIPVIRMSGYTSRVGWIEEGDETWLQKPFTPAALLQTIRAVLSAAAMPVTAPQTRTHFSQGS